MLKTLLTPELPAKTIIDRLEHIYHIPLVEQEKGEFGDMCNLGEAILERGIEQGIEQGMAQGEFKMLCLLVKRQMLNVKSAAECAGLSEEEFLKKMKSEEDRE